MSDFFSKARKLYDNASDKVQSELPNLKDKASHSLEFMKDKGKEAFEKAKPVASQARDAISASSKTVGDSLVEWSNQVKESDRYNAVFDKAKIIVAMPKQEIERLFGPSPNDNSTSLDGDETKDVENTIDELKKKDKVGVAGEALAAAGGAAAGAAVAGTFAAAAGATTLLGSTTLAGWVGGTLVVTTPIGWVIGSAAVMGAAGYGIAKLIQSGSEQDQVRKEIINRLTKRLEEQKRNNAQQGVLDELQAVLPIAIGNGLLKQDQADRMVNLIEQGKLDPEMALNRIKTMRVTIEVQEQQ
ncbi:hypothetical protein Ga0123462_0848 [Mariprofundus ferrinatatus]|uniref:Uncharacterized protein n=1 Tax=Mariprofundus ferrinatatus TaxID=1921087 RepID=A0A2K8L364_9PROT|nr:hypothetical protein [Mariprofundus ferrinatatus]ATX81717.1 hypothetical protein Ga0123462_0848 [Mariprofundus ferrinatatus]